MCHVVIESINKTLTNLFFFHPQRLLPCCIRFLFHPKYMLHNFEYLMTNPFPFIFLSTPLPPLFFHVPLFSIVITCSFFFFFFFFYLGTLTYFGCSSHWFEPCSLDDILWSLFLRLLSFLGAITTTSLKTNIVFKAPLDIFMMR